jgi:hypothetical protein
MFQVVQELCQANMIESGRCAAVLLGQLVDTTRCISWCLSAQRRASTVGIRDLVVTVAWPERQ